ncbi:hypothetical protein CALCODRAFT_496186 [Calocera cornea HHB12733]|uniref:C2H2-type domain-containing protein n=1 Tax=Calocera cornea HHB12733 TaxID=1353952 RepID=A0A165FYV2_9BASI|nr:hypothetical protein CALCODRAFT_496186 [Calocera cornea HHB12733]
MKKHGKARTRPCSRCGKDFARSDALTRHQKGTKNCPRPKVTGEDGKEGDKSEKDEPPLDDDEEEEEEGHGGEGDSRQGGSSSNQGTSQRPNSGWSSYGGMSDY